MSADIFISYRGADRVLARKLEYRLRSRWGSRVFRDETGVTSGRHWVKELTDAMQEARVIIALVGPGWHISSDEKAEDWVRQELATAVEGAKPILPVLVGESEALRPKLASMPEAFRRQAVVVGPELAGFDLHKIAKALGQLGAFRSDNACTLAARRDQMVPKTALEQAEKAIEDGHSLLVVGSSGSGRNALVQRLVDDQLKQENLVATYGLERGGGLRHTHAVISGWIKTLGDVFEDLNSPYSAKKAGRTLVKAVLEAGPDLLSRKVIKAPDDTVDEPLSGRERETWATAARTVWEDLKTIDPDQSVLSCGESDAGELLVSFAQADLIGHLRNRLSTRDARTFHERLARYLVDPIEELDREDYSDQYYRADLAAEHWSLAGRPRDAADAHRRAAQIAELSLAYGESRRHYHSAIRLYTQLIAEGRDPTRDHEDLLILANCFYRVGQTTRLSGNPRKADDGQPWGASNYLERALDRLAELKTLLLKNEPDRWPDGITGPCTRGIPGPNLVRHHLRVYDAVSGHVHLELAQCYEAIVDQCRARTEDELHSCSQCRHYNRLVRDRLFDALRHAEAAQGEAGSRWLLAAASARLAALLTNESLRTQLADSKRSDELAVEAFFHIERIIGLCPYTAEEAQEFADPVSVAWRSAGRLFRHHARKARIAEWCFRKMNDHGTNVTATVDFVTDRWLGGFLLSICTPGQAGSTIEHARALLERHRDWAIESGIVDWRTPAHLRLYLLELVETAADPSNGEARKVHLIRARQDALSDRHRRECGLFEALEEIIGSGSDPSGRARAVTLFRESLPELKNNPNDAVVLQNGASRLAGMLLRRCPPLVDQVTKLLQPLLAKRWDEGKWIQRAGEYLESLKRNRILSPCVDSVINDLARSRLAPKVYSQAIVTKKLALELLEIHQRTCIEEEGVDLNVLIRDVEYAAFMHDWYCGTDPARLLTLASEWNLKVSGEEWSNPRLLQGRLATTVLKIMYGAETVLGTSRFQRITNMVDNCVVGRPDATALAKVFFLADAISERRKEETDEGDIEPDWQTVAIDERDIDGAYSLAIKKKEQAPWDLGYVHVTDNGDESPTHFKNDAPPPNEELVPDDGHELLRESEAI